jgi:beta-lactamase superfamily II metal-dependent hydrolase
VIQAGKTNRYGHPSIEFIRQMSTYGKVMGTYQDKTVEVVTDGLTWRVK